MSINKTDTSQTTYSYYAEDISRVMCLLQVTKKGLSSAEVLRRQKKYGMNQIRVPSRLTTLTLFLNQFKSTLIIALSIAGIFSIIISLTTSESKWIEAIVIFLAVFTNVALGFWQEHKAEKSLELLHTYTKIKTIVIRNGATIEVDAHDLVPGDIIIFKQGDRIPADARIIKANDLSIDESALTGESLTVSKDPKSVAKGTSLGDRTSMVYSGTSVVEGSGEAVVTHTGDQTEFGVIAKLVANKKQEDTPLQKSIKQFSVKAGSVLFVMGIVLFLLGFFIAEKPVIDIFFIAVAAIVSAVPEGLPIAVTVVLAIGVDRLAKRKGIVRKLLAAETLGSTTTVLTDKTGTLTEANMKLVDIHTDDTVSYLDVIRRAVTNVDVFVSNPGADPSDWVMRGEPLEQALLQKAELEGISQKKERDRYHSFKRIPFDAERKFSAFVGWHEDGSAQIDILGAPEIVIHYTDLDPDRKQQIIEHISHEARNGARVLMLASANVGSCSKDSIDSCFENTVFTYYGVLSFRDPIRMSVRNSIIRITEGGVRTVIVTGDHKGTALYVAKELGIVTHENQACDSSDIDDMTDEQLMNATEHIRVFARATPTQKVRILQAFKKRGEIVAVTGDGVNDAPVLKTANIGVAMGSGTDVAKSASDLIILDDNYETIVSAIEEGRIIVDNLRKVIIFLLSDSFDELILIGGAILFNVGLPLTAIQILFVKVFTDTLPALSFPFDRGDHALQRDPTKIRSSLFDFETKVFTIGRGLFSAVFLFGLYYVLLQYTQIDDAVVRTFVFASFSTYILFLVFPLRSIDLNIWEFNPFSNWYINIAVILGFVMTLLAIYQPWLRDMLGTTYLPMHYMIGVIGVGISNVISMELLKLWFKNKKNT